MTVISRAARKSSRLQTRLLTTRSSPLTINGAVWVNNNYEWSCWFDLLWKFIWTFKRFLHTLVIVHFQWIQHLLLPLLEKLKNWQCFVVNAALNWPPIPSSWFVIIFRRYLFKSPGYLRLIVFTCCLGCSSRHSASALERLPLVIAFLIRLLLRRRTEQEENQQTNSRVKENMEGKTTGCIHTWKKSEDSSSDCFEESKVRLCSIINLRRLVLISISDKIQTINWCKHFWIRLKPH